METITTIAEARRRRQVDRIVQRTVALVPTMGFLHEGHLSLVRRAHELADTVWVSIFVNPTQFGPEEDLDRYPRDFEHDQSLLETHGVAVLLAPADQEIYPEPPTVEILFSGLENLLCGNHRPVHFGGVGLVVAKLFNIVQPEVAVFGQKDAQQAILIKRLVADLNFAVEIEVAPTVRESDGLAMSSRNAYLSTEQRAAAPIIYRALCAGRETILGGEQDPIKVTQLMASIVGGESQLLLEYAECVSQVDLATPPSIDGPVLLVMAAHAGATRLIDNLPVFPGRPSEN